MYTKNCLVNKNPSIQNIKHGSNLYFLNKKKALNCLKKTVKVKCISSGVNVNMLFNYQHQNCIFVVNYSGQTI